MEDSINPAAYSTMDYREELARVRKARRRNAAIVIVADIAIIAGIAYIALTGLVF